MKKGILAAFVAALALTAEIYAQTNDTGNMETKERIYGSVFPRGEKLPEMFAKYFTGQAYLARLTRDEALNCPVSNVTFEPGCRNNWHSHTGGQLLVAVSGRGYYQAKGEPARELLPGDVVEIGPGVVHWHGAAPDSWFSHLAVEMMERHQISESQARDVMIKTDKKRASYYNYYSSFFIFVDC